MSSTELKATIKRELPGFQREDPAFRTFVLDLTREAYADRAQTTDWFQQAMAEKHDRSIGALGARWGLQSERAFRDVRAPMQAPLLPFN